MLIKSVVIIFILLILFNLFSGLYYLVRDQGKTDRTVKALTWRIGISVALFILLIIGFALGIITPHPLGG